MTKTRASAFRLALGTSVMALALAGGQAAFAQDQADDPQEADEIIVTAQNREQSLQDVPISLTVVQGDTLSENAIVNFEELYPRIPNFAVTKSPAADIIVMRGIGSSAGSPSLEQSVVMFIDGIYAGNSRQFAAPFLDVQRMEFLRGPQGALVGRNTSAGAISVVSRRPSFDFEGFVDASYDLTLEGPSIDAGLNIPLTDNLALRAVIRYVDIDGWVYNRLSGEDEATRAEIIGRVSALYQEGPFSIFAKYERGDVSIDGSPVQVFTVLGGRGRDYEMEKEIPGRDEFDDLETENAVLEVSYDAGGFTLMSITGLSSFTNTNLIDADFTEAALATADFDQTMDQVSQEFRILSPTGRFFEFVAGVYYQRATFWRSARRACFSPRPQAPTGSSIKNRASLRSMAKARSTSPRTSALRSAAVTRKSARKRRTCASRGRTPRPSAPERPWRPSVTNWRTIASIRRSRCNTTSPTI